jgi:transcription elongation GreA/GreB family factor
MTDREKVVKQFMHLLNAAKGNYQDFVDLTVDLGEEIAALLREQERRINELEEKLRLMEYGDQDTLQSGMMPAT